jgi:hypothetical protein
MNIATNNFAKRQTPESQFSHFEVTSVVRNNDKWKFLEYVIARDWFKKEDVEGRPGVVKMVFNKVEDITFYSGVQEITKDTVLEASLFQRSENELPYINVLACGKKSVAKIAEVILYSHEALGSDASTDADYEIVSINARITEEPEPPTPISMARNFLNLPGGSTATYTAEEFAKSIIYWSTRCMTK